MPLFIVETEISQEVIKYIADTKARLKSDSILFNPFIGDINAIELKGKLIHIVKMRPIWPNLTHFGWLFIVSGFVFYDNIGLLIYPGLALVLCGFFWSGYFYYLMYCLGLKRAGYKDKAKLQPFDSFIDSIVFKEGENEPG